MAAGGRLSHVTRPRWLVCFHGAARPRAASADTVDRCDRQGGAEVLLKAYAAIGDSVAQDAA